MTSLEQRKTRIEKIRLLPSQIEALTDGLTNEQLTTPYLPGEWTVARMSTILLTRT